VVVVFYHYVNATTWTICGVVDEVGSIMVEDVFVYVIVDGMGVNVGWSSWFGR
jgi:hypothetical protein